MKMKRFSIFALTTVLLLAAVQLSIMALNNKASGSRTFEMGKYVITQKWGYDQDPPPGQGAVVLESYAYAQVATAPAIRDAEGNIVEKSEISWSANSGASYAGNNANYESSYSVSVDVLVYHRSAADNDVVGTMNASESLAMSITPIPENTEAEIDDCSANGQASGINPTDNSMHSTESDV